MKSKAGNFKIDTTAATTMSDASQSQASNLVSRMFLITYSIFCYKSMNKFIFLSYLQSYVSNNS